ncbi:MAG: RNA-binding S4 domain-containing protein [Rhizobiales bacterium]|nr:RNA-binding S4 domain-containing protein [Hyphomicrobiales bacterium]
MNRGVPPPDSTPDHARLEVWLWRARFAKTRALAARLVSAGHVRVNGARAQAPAKAVRPGDVLTIALPRDVRLVRILALGERRGPAREAQALFEPVRAEGAGD